MGEYTCWRCGAKDAYFASHIGPNGAWFRASCSAECADAWGTQGEREALWKAYKAGVEAGAKYGMVGEL